MTSQGRNPVPYSSISNPILLTGTAKKLVENTKQLVAGAAADQSQLKEAALAAEKTIHGLAEAVKLGAGALSIDDVETQVPSWDSSVSFWRWASFAE